MIDHIRMSRVALVIGLGLALTACSSMNKPLSKSYGVASKANFQAQVVPVDPSTVESGPTPTSAERAAVARKAYDTGQVSDSVKKAESTGGR